MTTPAPASAGCPFRAPGLLDPDYVADPYPLLARAQAEAPVWYAEDFGLWVVTRHADVAGVLRDPATFSSANVQQPVLPISAAALDVYRTEGFRPGIALTATDPPRHTAVRRDLMKALAFTPARLAALEPRIAAATDALIDRFAAAGRADLAADLANRLPALVIFDLIGFPEGDRAQLQRWCLDRLRMSWGRTTEAEQVESAKNVAAYWRHCVAHVAASGGAGRGDPPDTITGALIRAHRDHPEALPLSDVAGLIFGLVFAGQETTATLIAGTLLLLLEDRARWQAASADRSTLPAIVEEGLRLTAPIMAWRRVLTRPACVGGVDLPAGAELLLHLGAANRDPGLFADPQAFDPARPNAGQHLAFGLGIHFCLGAALARLEACIVLDRVLTRLPDLRLPPGFAPRYLPNIAFRTLAALPAEWTPAGAA